MSGVFGKLVDFVKKIIISKWPLKAAAWIGVLPLLFGAFRQSVNFVRNFTISKWPLKAAMWIGVVPLSAGAFGTSANFGKFLTISKYRMHTSGGWKIQKMVKISWLSVKKMCI